MELSPFIWSQVAATFMLCFDLASFQFKGRKEILLCLVISSAFNAAHFVMLGQSAAGAIIFVSVLRFLVSYFSTSQWWMGICMILSVASTLMGSFTFVTIFALLGSLINTWAAFRPGDYLLRIGMLVGISFWILHNVLVWTPVGILVECIFLTSNLIGLWRFYGRSRPIVVEGRDSD